MRFMFLFFAFVLCSSFRGQASESCNRFYSDRSFIIKKLTSFDGATGEVDRLIGLDISAERILFKIMQESKAFSKVKVPRVEVEAASEKLSNHLYFCASALKIIESGALVESLTQNEIWSFFRRYEKTIKDIGYFTWTENITSSERAELQRASLKLQEAAKRSDSFNKILKKGYSLVPPEGTQIKKNLSDKTREAIEELELYRLTMGLDLGFQNSDFFYSRAGRIAGEFNKKGPVFIYYLAVSELNRLLRDFTDTYDPRNVDLDRIVRVVEKFRAKLNSDAFNTFIQSSKKSFFPTTRRLALSTLVEVSKFETYSKLVLQYSSRKIHYNNQAAVNVTNTKMVAIPENLKEYLKYLIFGSNEAPIPYTQGLGIVSRQLPGLVKLYQQATIALSNDQKSDIQNSIALLESIMQSLPKNWLSAKFSMFTLKEFKAAETIRAEIVKLKAMVAE